MKANISGEKKGSIELPDRQLANKLTRSLEKLYDPKVVPYDWKEILRLIELDSEIFNICVRRASRYPLSDTTPRSYKVWMACNLARGYECRKDCYFCGKIMSREEFLAGKVHLEHFLPRDKGGEHIPINLTWACVNCNSLKRNLIEDDFDLLLENPELFRVSHRLMRIERYQQLVEFTEICMMPRLKGNSWFFSHFQLTSQSYRVVWEKMKMDYRQKWGIDK